MCDSITIIIFKLLTFLFRCHFLTTTYPTMDHIYRIIFIILSYGCQLQGIPLQKPKYTGTLSNVQIVKHEPQRTKEYVEMFFLPMPPNYRNKVDLRYTVHKPLKRPDLPRNLLTMATHADFDKLSDEGSEIQRIFSKEKQIIANLTSEELLVPNTDLIRGSMETIFNKPRNALVDSYARDIVGSYIYEKFGRSGLVVTIQDYTKDLPLKKYMQMKGMDFNPDSKPAQLSGSNIIGILPGKYWSTKKDRPIIIGAHWDTVLNSTGFNDNGSGVAILLEVARVLGGATDCFQPDYTLFFVAIDSEEDGSYGSQEFLHKIIVPYYIKQGVGIQGGIILDTLFNFDPTPDSQDTPEEWENAIPDAIKRIKANDNRGDFMAIIGRNHPDEQRMTDLIKKWSTLDGLKTEEFNLKKMPPYHEPTLETLQEHAYFWQSDNSRFWFYKEGASFTSFPALLLTDTAYYRGYMRECYHSECDKWDQKVATKERWQFMTTITQSLVLSIVEMSMEGHKSKCLKNTVQHLIEKATSTAASPKVETTTMASTTLITTTTETTTVTTTVTTRLTTVPTTTLSTTITTPISTSTTTTAALDDYVINEISDTKPSKEPLVSQLDIQDLLRKELQKIVRDVAKPLPKPSQPLTKPSQPINIGTQINIQNLNIDLRSQNQKSDLEEEVQQCRISEEKDEREAGGLFLGTSQDVLDYEKLSNIVQNFYGGQQDKIKDEQDQQKNLQRKKNSPMLIKFFE